MTDALREALQRVGDEVSPAAVPGDVWARGRRARRRARASAAGGLVAVVLLVFGGVGLVAGLPGQDVDAGPVAGGEGGAEAVPSVLYDVPGRFAHLSGAEDTRWSDRVAEADLRLGRVSLAFTSGEHTPLPVVVTAADGAYHPLHLPGWLGASVAGGVQNEQAFAVSPDGRRLAWAWYEFRGAAVTSGLRVADLESGRTKSVSLLPGKRIAPHSITWSPNSKWILWTGLEATTWSPNEFGATRFVAGRVRPGGVESEAIPDWSNDLRSRAIGDNGWVFTAQSDGSHSVWTGRTTSSGRTMDGPELPVNGPAAVSPDGSMVAVSTASVSDDGATAWFVRAKDWLEIGRPMAEDIGIYPMGASARPVGWVDEDLVVSMITPGDGAPPEGYDAPHLAVMSAPTVPEGEWTFRVLMRLAPGFDRPGSVTVAVDLLDPLKTTTRDFPAPEWPWSDERKWLTGLAVGVPLLATGIFFWTYRRARRLT